MMILFWIIMALMVLLALAFVLWPLLRVQKKNLPSQDEANIRLYKDQLEALNQSLARGEITAEVHKELKEQAEKGLVQDVPTEPKKSESILVKPSFITAIVLVVLVPICSLYLYSDWGDSKQLEQYYFEKSHAKQINAEIKKFKNPEQLVAKLKSVLKEHPESAQGWFLLGRLYSGMTEYKSAVSAFAKAIKYKPKDDAYKLQYAQASFFANHKKLNTEALTLVNEVIAKQADNPAAINLIALNAFSQKQYQKAIDSWETLLNVFPANTKDGKVIMNAISEAQKRLSESGGTVAPSGPELKVHVSISKTLAKKIAPDVTVFVYAKAVNGVPMPLAIERLQVKDFPTTVILSNAQAMLAKHNLSSVNEIYVVARISKHGTAMPEKGDIESKSKKMLLNNSSKLDINLTL